KLMHSYLTGLIEGDGNIYIPLNKEKKGCPSISISFPTKDLPLFLLIQKEINYGNIYKIKGKNAYEYVIGKLDGIVLVISYINGLMRTKKILKLYELIDFLNMKYPNLYNIVKLPLDNSDLGNGSFYVRVSKNSNCKTHKVYCKYELAQAYDNNNIYTFNIMTKICKFLLVDLKIILKLAIYGIIRILLSNISEISLLYAPILYVIGIITIIYSSLVTLSQTDLKVIIAYSSISHLGVCILGIFANNLLGIIGSLVLCLAHGFVSPALFILMGGVLYDRYHNRVLLYYQGLTQFMPLFAVYLVFFSFSNTGTPLTYNFIGEFLCITGAIIKHPIIGVLTASSVLLSACYQMKLTNKLTSGTFSKYLHITHDLLYREHFILFFLALPTLVLGIVPNFISNILYLSSNALIYS
ncbi:NADH dehydrogenase subunit 4, partial [Pichia californica]